MGPQSCTVRLKSGVEYKAHCDIPYGSPGNRMDKAAREAKVRKCFEVGGRDADPQRLIDTIELIEKMDDVRDLFSSVCD